MTMFLADNFLSMFYDGIFIFVKMLLMKVFVMINICLWCLIVDYFIHD